MAHLVKDNLTGRIDGYQNNQKRWHQIIKYIDLEKEIILPNNNKNFVFLGFSSDEGIRRNKGRIGAMKGPLAIKEAIANFPVHFDDIGIFDAGSIVLDSNDLDEALELLSKCVKKLLALKAIPIVLGGGHDLSYGHFTGLNNYYQKNKKIGIINFDAHFDIRPVDPRIGNTSGTSIWKIANDLIKQNEKLYCLNIGIQKFANTKYLFDIAHKFNSKYILADDLMFNAILDLKTQINDFLTLVDKIYVTVCMDVFSAAFSPGVSAPSPNGVIPDKLFFSLFDLIIKNDKAISFDFAETNPKYDIDNRTAKLASSLIFRIVTN